MLNTFTPPQKRTFLKLVRDLAVSDRDVSVSENTVIKQVCEEMGVSALTLTSSKDEAPLGRVFDTAEGRAIVLLELVRLCVSDKALAAEEARILRTVRQQLGFSEKALKDAVKLAEVYNLLLRGVSALAAANGARED